MSVTVFAEIESIETSNGGAAQAEGAAPRARQGMIGTRGPADPERRPVAVAAPRGAETREGEQVTAMLGPDDVVPIEYSAVPGTTTNMPGTHAYPDQAAPLTAITSTIRGRLLAPHSGSFELHVASGPASTVQVGRVRLSLAEA